MKNDLVLIENGNQEHLAFIRKSIESDIELSESSKHKYTRAISKYFTHTIESNTNPLDGTALREYAIKASDSERSFLSASINKFAKEAKRELTAMEYIDMPAQEYQNLQVHKSRMDLLATAIKYQRQEGNKTHTWLSQAGVKQLIATCQNENKTRELRDKVILSLIVGAGLRRAEVASLKFSDIKLQPIKGKIRTSLHVFGKGAKERTVPINDTIANMLDDWRSIIQAGENDKIARTLGRWNDLQDDMSTTAIFHLIAKKGAMIGKPKLAPHDLRRTYAQLGYEAGVPLVQISKLLGHASVKTTQKYLNTDLDLHTTISDFITLE